MPGNPNTIADALSRMLELLPRVLCSVVSHLFTSLNVFSRQKFLLCDIFVQELIKACIRLPKLSFLHQSDNFVFVDIVVLQ